MLSVVVVALLVVVGTTMGQDEPAKCCFDNQWSAVLGQMGGYANGDPSATDNDLHVLDGYTIIGYDFYRKREGTASHFRQPDGTYDVKYEIRDFENRMDYTVKGNASCESRPLPDSMRMFPPCIPDNATFVGDGDLGYGSGMLGLNTWSFTVHNRTTNVDVNIRLAVTKKNCVPVAEVVQGHRNQRFFEITNFFTGYHPGLDSLKHMEIPTNCPLAPATTAGTGAPVGR